MHAASTAFFFFFLEGLTNRKHIHVYKAFFAHIIHRLYHIHPMYLLPLWVDCTVIGGKKIHKL
jgi:hypothetical protein